MVKNILPVYRTIFAYLIISSATALAISGCDTLRPAAKISSAVQSSATITPSPTAFEPEPVLTVANQTVPEPITQNTPQTAAKFPDPAKYQWTLTFTGFDKPVDLAPPPGEPSWLVVVEQPGVIRLIQEGALIEQPYLDIRDRVGSNGSEQGLLGIAFHPQYDQNRFFYVNYTDRNGGTVIARFTASPDGRTVDSQTELDLIKVDQPYANHNGGGLAFGLDGLLYIGLGDGGSGGDPQNNAQNTNTLLGKMLRIDVNQQDGYSIPVDNPFANGDGKPEIWAYGLRNPWRFSFDAETGDLYIGDVGQNIWEEVDFLPAGSPGGANFGWNILEGSHLFRDQGGAPAGLINPITEYDHNSGCSITGGLVYRGKALPEWQGVYLYGDYCRGTIWGLINSESGINIQQIAKITGNISAFGFDGSGEVYAMEHSRGEIYKLTNVPE